MSAIAAQAAIATTLLREPATLGGLLDVLARTPAAPLVFSFAGRETSRGYHISEVKSATFDALDCGANAESWREIFLQLWDIPETSDSRAMTAGKALAILRVVETRIGLDREAKVTFEVSDGHAPITLYRPASATLDAGRLVIALAPTAASCKPRDRWLAGTPTPADLALAAGRAAQKASCCPADEAGAAAATPTASRCCG